MVTSYKTLSWIIVAFVLATGASAYWTEMREIRDVSYELRAETPELTIVNVESYIYDRFSENYWTDGSKKYQEPHQTWKSGGGDCTDFAELAKLMLYYNGVRTERVKSTTPEGGLHDMLWSAYGYVNVLKTPISRVNGGGYW